MFAYGATGAGKTHTMLGSQDDPGVMYRTMTELFSRMDEAREDKEFSVAFSYLEVNIRVFCCFFFFVCSPNYGRTCLFLVKVLFRLRLKDFNSNID